MKFNISVVLPCYNEENNIHLLYQEFIKIKFKNEKIELIFVNNGSTDKTDQEIEKVIALHKKNKIKNIHLKKIFLKRNQNYSGGVIAGLKKAKGAYIGWSHADLQTPLKDVYKLYKLIKNKKNVLGKGFRVRRNKIDQIITFLHEILAGFILHKGMREINAAPKIFSRNLIDSFNNMPRESTLLDTYILYICLKNKYEIVELNVKFKDRRYGSSKWKNNLKNFLKHTIINFFYLIKLRFQNDNN